MQTAYLYIRVSTDEQASKGYSQRNQEEHLLKFCSNNKIEIGQVIFEDYSAKTFNRPEWKKLLFLLKHLKKEVRPGLLLFTRWDRFSRNAADAYYMLTQLKKIGIDAQAIDQPLNLSVPENKIMLAIYLATSEVENDRRSLNVRQGMHRAKKEGRCMGHAPIGYRNTTAPDGKKYIVPFTPEATIIRCVFAELAEGNSSIRKTYLQAKVKGLKCSLNNFWLFVHNPIYCGKIKVPEFEQEKAHLVTGTHEGLISERLFNQVQNVLHNRSKHQVKVVNNNQLPLRGFLKCPLCQQTLTGSASKGRSRYYYYYHCTSECKFRVRADQINDLFVSELNALVPGKYYISLYKIISGRAYKRIFGDLYSDHSTVIKNVDQQFERVIKAKDLLSAGEIDADDYLLIKADCEDKIHALGRDLHHAALLRSTADKTLNDALRKFSEMPSMYENADIIIKRGMIRLLAAENMTCDGHKFIAPFNETVRIIYDLDDQAAIANTRDEIGNSNTDMEGDPFYSEECIKLTAFEQSRNRQIAGAQALKIILYLQNFAEIALMSKASIN